MTARFNLTLFVFNSQVNTLQMKNAVVEIPVYFVCFKHSLERGGQTVLLFGFYLPLSTVKEVTALW